AKNMDQNLADMAQQLEAALRRSPQAEHRPPVTDPLAMPAEHAPRDSKLRAEIRPEPRAEARIQPKSEPKVEPKVDLKIEPKAEPRFEQKIEPKVQYKPEPRLEQPSPAPKIEPLKAEPAVDKALYDNLEEEMASLLGRPSGKT